MLEPVRHPAPVASRSARGVRAAALTLLLALVGVLAPALWPGRASAQPGGAQTQLQSDAQLSAVSCPAPGACVAVGSFQATGGVPLGLLEGQTRGVWSSPLEAHLPPGAGATPNVDLTAVACAAVGSCTAVGDYTSASFLQQGVLLNLRGGQWRRGVRAPLPSGAAGDPGVTLDSVSCGAPGDCTAVGSYLSPGGSQVALALTETGWRWAPGVAVPLPAGASGSSLDSVSCAAAGSCSAVGWFVAPGGAIQGLLETQSAGAWGAAVIAGLPAGAAAQPQVSLTSVSCSSAGSCTAVGDYDNAGGSQLGLLIGQRHGGWSAAATPSLPPNALATQATALSSVSCTGPGYCTAAGSYTDQAQTFQGLLLTEQAGSWQPGVEPPLPANAAANQVVTLNSIACFAYETCVAAGNYFGAHPTGLLLSEVGGRWLQPISAFMPRGEAGDPYAALSSVACAAGPYCDAVGTYVDGAGNGQGVLLDGNGRFFRRGLAAPLPGGLQTAARTHRRGEASAAVKHPRR